MITNQTQMSLYKAEAVYPMQNSAKKQSMKDF